MGVTHADNEADTETIDKCGERESNDHMHLRGQMLASCLLYVPYNYMPLFDLNHCILYYQNVLISRSRN
jgi:hypothetical protein